MRRLDRSRWMRWLAPAAGLALLLVACPASAQPYEAEGELEVMGLDSTRTADATYVGAMVCRQCHPAAFETWLGTGHARSWVFLSSPAAMEVARRHLPDMEVPPEMGMAMVVPRMAPCLACHSTAADVEPAQRDEGFYLEDGVQCEACHGPGSMHIHRGLVIAGQALQASRMEIPDTEDACRVCHKRERPSHDWMQKPPFDYEAAKARIAHPTTRQARLQLLREEPGGYLSISLRTLLGHIFGG